MSHASSNKKTWSIILAYYNEADFLERTLESLAQQSQNNFTLYLINNASTDHSPEIAKNFAKKHPHLDIQCLLEKRPGQVFAQQNGLSHVSTPFVAVCDADVFYPPNYLQLAEESFLKKGKETVAVLGLDLYSAPDCPGPRSKIFRWALDVSLHPIRKSCHSGGYAHNYRSEILKQAGGFVTPKWPYLFYDHEMAHRVQKLGKIFHNPKLVCFPSDRRPAGSHPGKRNFLEHLFYGITPGFLKDWYFYKFLGPRFLKRGAVIEKLRKQPWEMSENLPSE